jgi:hypothetical protein
MENMITRIPNQIQHVIICNVPTLGTYSNDLLVCLLPSVLKSTIYKQMQEY